MIYLDNAATSGVKPRSVIDAVVTGMKKYSANPGRGGHKASLDAAEKIYEVRNKVSSYFNVNDVNSVCFTAGCTASINYVLYGCLKSGDHVIISSLEHNAVLRPLVYLSETRKIKVDVLKVNINKPFDCINQLEELVKPKTKMVILTHASNVFGTVLPIYEIGKICKKNGILFAVDAAQSAGHIPIDVEKMNIDFLCVAPHKGLYAPMGCGILICKSQLEDVLIKGGTGVNSISPYQPTEYPERLESGTVNLPAILGIGAGIDFVSNKKLMPYKKMEASLIGLLYDKLKGIGAIIYNESPTALGNVPVLSFNLKHKSSEETALALSQNGIAVRGGLHCAPLAHKFNGTVENGTVRVSTSVFNTENDIEKLIFVLKKQQNNY